MSELRLAADEAGHLVVEALTASRTNQTNARSVAQGLIAAELAGQGGHGLRRAVAYASQARSGKVDGSAVPRHTREREAVIAIDAGNGFAFPAFDLAIDVVPGIARAQGIALCGIRRSHHAGVAGLTVERFATEGLVAIMFANAPAAMAPWGAARPLFGTNPIAFACPLAGGDPIVVDVSLSRVARGKLMAAAQTGKAIPEGWAFDAEGHATTDPRKGMAGTMAPMGDAKGTALALMVELLSAGLTGANYAYEATSFFDDKGPPPGTGQLIIVIDPGAFGGVDALARFAEMSQIVAESDGARLPGQRRRAIRDDFLRNGIPVDPVLLDEINAIIAAKQS